MDHGRIGTTRALRRAALAMVLLLTVVLATSRPSEAADAPGKPAACVENDPNPYCVRTLSYATVQGPTVVLPGQTVTVVFAPSIPKCVRGQETTYPAPCWNIATLSPAQGSTTSPPFVTPGACNIVQAAPPYYCVFTVSAAVAVPTWMKWSASVSYFEPGVTPDIQELYGEQKVIRKNALAELATYYGGGVSADFRYDIDGGIVSFHSKSRDGQNRTLFETWDFGDGTSGVGANPEHRYTRSGTYAVTLTAENTDHEQNSITRTVQVEAEPLAIADLVIDPSPLEVGKPGSVSFTVVNNGEHPVTGIAPVVTFDPADQVAVADDSELTSFDLAGGAEKAFTVPVDVVKAGETGETFVHIAASGLLDGEPTDATPASLVFDVVGNPGLNIQLDGQVIQIGKSFTVTMTITNPTEDAIDALTWTGPNGLVVESGDNPAAAQPNVSYVSGPDAPLPTSLEAGASANVSYVFNAPTVGASVFTVTASGTARSTSEPITTKQAMTVLAVANWTEQVRDQVAKDGLMQILGAIADGRTLAADSSMSQVIAALGFDDPTPAALAGATQAGISDPSLQRLAASAATSRSTEPGLIRSISDDWVGGYAEKMDEFGVAGGQHIANFVDAVMDPVQRQAIADNVWEKAKQLPTATLENAGYLGQAIVAPPTLEGLQSISDAASSTTHSVTSAMGEAVVGLGPVIDDYRQQLQTDPTQARHDLVKFSGGLFWTSAEAGMSAALGEAGTAAVVKVAAPVARTGLKVFTSGGGAIAEDAISVGSTVAAENAAESMVLRQAQAAAVMDSYQALPAGTVLNAAQVTGKGGLLAEDAASIQATIREAEAKFGTEFVVSVRSSEPLSAGLEGIAKPEFIKPKAVSVLDMMLGADPARAGKVAIFNPTPLADTTVASLEAANPGFAAKYYDRLTSQRKIWADWNAPGDKLRSLTSAGAKYADEGGITVLLSRPGNPVPHGLQYLEQLAEPEFLAAKGINPADVPAIRQSIQESNIVQYKAAPIAVEGPNGMVYIDDAVAKQPYLSDADIQAVAPKSGEYPKGVSRGQVTTFFKAKLDKLERFPFHGWSDAAFDLPSDFYMSAVPFQLGNANPATAIRAAEKVAGRLQLLENLSRTKAAALLAKGDAKAAQKILDRLAEMERFKDPATGSYSTRKLLEAFPPGEKTINFTAGDIRVGYGTGGN
jgi:PKD repeat protein